MLRWPVPVLLAECVKQRQGVLGVQGHVMDASYTYGIAVLDNLDAHAAALSTCGPALCRSMIAALSASPGGITMCVGGSCSRDIHRMLPEPPVSVKSPGTKERDAPKDAP